MANEITGSVLSCGHCDGLGYRDHEDYDGGWGETWGWREECPACDGAGSIDLPLAPATLGALDNIDGALAWELGFVTFEWGSDAPGPAMQASADDFVLPCERRMLGGF